MSDKTDVVVVDPNKEQELTNTINTAPDMSDKTDVVVVDPNKEQELTISDFYTGQFSLKTYSPHSDESADIQAANFERKVLDQAVCGIMGSVFIPRQSLKWMELCEGASYMKSKDNAGGSSEISEFLSFEVLHRCFGAELCETETEVDLGKGPRVDYTCRIFGAYRGVSVTRIMKNIKDAKNHFEKKLCNINEFNKNYKLFQKKRKVKVSKKKGKVKVSTKKSKVKVSTKMSEVSNVETCSKGEGFKQILHIWTDSENSTNAIIEMFKDLPEEIKSKTMVLVTIAKDTPEIFSNKIEN
ncbi:hypothetical protein CAPTEDRAFT_208412 [Capitella teleta]|uniref:Uncharacterized protein n=1 Tax=Capitella teleta TaxID=283909 RepID=R7TWD6_CAPTE|nr:hypothetical protein CAPTEDRAFT_208412 [Capitella teleta]|eukprot:ELT98059.1 hypothetical protein CAPTEDRAFT_208412 [Capitella teleta]